MVRRIPICRPITQQRAKALRRAATPPEQLVWELLRDRRLAGLKFRRQFPIGPYIADFYCRDARLVIELDGDSHDGRAARDAERTRNLESLLLRVFRIANDDVYLDLESVAFGIVRAAGLDVQSWWHARTRARFPADLSATSPAPPAGNFLTE